MYYNEITEEMWDKIEAEGIVVLSDCSEYVNFVKDYKKSPIYAHAGIEMHHNLEDELILNQEWGYTWKIVKRPASMVKAVTQSTKTPVVEWLDKASYVYTNDDSVESFVLWDEVKIETSHGDIKGANAVVEFINNRYELLQKEAKSNKQKELAEKKAKLLEELDAIDKELEGI